MSRPYQPSHTLARVTQQERVAWALTRLRAARFKANMHKDDRALAVAVVARQQEYERERHVLHITQPT